MPPKQAMAQTAKRGGGRRSTGKSNSLSPSKARRRTSQQMSRTADPFESSDEEQSSRSRERDTGDATENFDDESDGDEATVVASGVRNAKSRKRSRNDGGSDEEADTSTRRASRRIEEEEGEEDDQAPEKVIPAALVTKLLHVLFQREGTRMTEDASNAAGKYMDVFVREAIARCIHEREGGFLEVEDLEKISAQLLMDF